MTDEQGKIIEELVGKDWETCPLHRAQKVLWRQDGSWMGPMELSLCIWPSFAEYVFVKRKDTTEKGD